MLIVPEAADSASDTFGIDTSNKQPPRHFCYFISIIRAINVCTSDLANNSGKSTALDMSIVLHSVLEPSRAVRHHKS